ncbi:MAG: hypothetical protein JWP79_1068 [Polaromonas sp.]|jgi:hypothetical protein|nr:hypothetical protein [Polaromonas sp.]
MCRQHYDTVGSLPALMDPLMRQAQCDNFKLGIGQKTMQRHIKS